MKDECLKRLFNKNNFFMDQWEETSHWFLCLSSFHFIRNIYIYIYTTWLTHVRNLKIPNQHPPTPCEYINSFRYKRQHISPPHKRPQNRTWRDYDTLRRCLPIHIHPYIDGQTNNRPASNNKLIMDRLHPTKQNRPHRPTRLLFINWISIWRNILPTNLWNTHGLTSL